MINAGLLWVPSGHGLSRAMAKGAARDKHLQSDGSSGVQLAPRPLPGLFRAACAVPGMFGYVGVEWDLELGFWGVRVGLEGFGII